MTFERKSNQNGHDFGSTPIPRVLSPSYKEFLQYVRHKQPVIIEGLFESQHVARIQTLQRARQVLGKLPVVLQPEYYSDFLKSGDLFRQRSRPTTLARFLDHLFLNPKSRLVVTEQPSVAELSDLMKVPKLCAYRYGLDGSEGIASEMFIAGAGNCAHLHFDWDQRHVLLYQVFGRKRLCLIKPEHSALLNPVLNMSQLNIENLTEAVREKVLGALGAYSDVLRPGETVYIPPLMWHCLEYIDTAMSISLRFGRTEQGRIFQERFHPNMHLQNISWKMLEHEVLRGKLRVMYERIITEYVKAPRRGFSLYKRMQGIFEEVYREVCTESIQERCWLPPTVLADQQVKLGIKAGVLYSTSIARRDARIFRNGFRPSHV